MLTDKDLLQLKKHEITPEKVERQLHQFKTGFPFLKLKSAANVGDGIIRLSDNQKEQATTRWEQFLSDGGESIKMVPASGAASRMFKAMFNFLETDSDTAPENSDAAAVIDNLEQFAFYQELNEILKRLYGKTAQELRENGEHKKIISAIVNKEGLNYGNLPKGLISFHNYPNGPHTPIEEQLAEGAATEKRADGTVHIHFTVSADHCDKFNERLNKGVSQLGKELEVKFVTSLSEQKKSTDTLAVNPDNTPFRLNGELVFRPGGHGALIENLNDLDATVVFLKNIDNVVPESRRKTTLEYKKILAGYLLLVHDKIINYLGILESDAVSDEQLKEMTEFLREELNIDGPKINTLNRDDLRNFLINKFDRPLRVCGMVKNEGEPGGGPYLAYGPDGTSAPQILESTQIDITKSENRDMISKASHFNPVDLVCYIKNHKGIKFDLTKYVDTATGFISEKSLHGRTLRALELPGLWNGAMSDWSTIFVEVPAETFNPVKTINDLLRPTHIS